MQRNRFVYIWIVTFAYDGSYTQKMEPKGVVEGSYKT